MATRMQQRRGTALEWLEADPVLAAGEIGFETDTNSFKIGDGINNWSLLDYFETSASQDLSGTLEDYVLLTEKGAPLGVATLDADGFVPAEQLNIDVTGDINAAISALVGDAPELLDTLSELADALGDNPAAITDLQTAVAAKQDALTAGTNIDITDSTISVAGLASTDISDFNTAAISATSAEYDAAGSATTAETNAKAYTDTRETAITTAYESYADAAETDAKAYTDTAISGVNTTISNLTTDEVDEGTTNKYFSDTLARGAVSAGDGLDYDSATGVFSAGIGYGLKLDANGDIQVDGDLIATDLDVANIIGDETVDGTSGNTVTDRIASAVSGLVDSAPATLDTLNELAAALGDDANFATTVTNSIAAKADAVHTHLLSDLTDITATVTELNYVSGVTSAIQTQIDAKPDNINDLGDVTITSAASGEFLGYNGTGWVNTSIIDGGNA